MKEFNKLPDWLQWLWDNNPSMARAAERDLELYGTPIAKNVRHNAIDMVLKRTDPSKDIINSQFKEIDVDLSTLDEYKPYPR